MAVDPGAKRSKSDPDRWKPLLAPIVGVTIVVPLATVEYQLVSEIVRTGSQRGIVQALLYGLLLIYLIPALCIAIWNLMHRPSPDERLRHARTLLGGQPKEQQLFVRSSLSSPPNIAVYAALPITLLGLAIYGAWIGNLPLFFVMLVAGIVIGGTMLFVFTPTRKASSPAVLTVDTDRKMLRFENFLFMATFLPEPPRAMEEVAFEQVLGSDYQAAGGGSASLLVRTTKGTVMIPETVDNFEQVRAILASLVEINRSNPTAYQKRLDEEPQIRTAWYGWVILLGSFGAVGYLMWKFMYTD